MNIVKSKVNRLKNEDISTVGQRVIDTINQSAAEEVKKSVFLSQLLNVTSRFRKAIEPNDKEEMAAINLKFKERKLKFKNLHSIASGLTGSNDAAVKTAATAVFAVLNMYGGVSFRGLSRTAHTQRYTNMTDILKQPEYTDALTKLNITGFVNELANANLEYETLFQTKGNKQSLRTPPHEMRTEMNNALKVIVDELNLFARKYPEVAYTEVLKNVEQRIMEVYVPAPGSTKQEETTESSQSASQASEVL